MQQTTTRALLPHHAKLIEDSGIAPEVARQRGYFSAVESDQLAELGFAAYQRSVPALVIPIFNTTGSVATHQVRPDRPRLTDAGKELKYETPAGSALALDVHPASLPQLGDPKTPLFISEGSRKIDSAVSRGLCAVGLLGVTGWRGRNESGGVVALPDWDNVALNGREVFIVFDSDIMSKDMVSLECERLLRFLRHRKARALRILLPSGPNGEKVGLDDFFAAGHDVQDLARFVEQPQASGEKKERESRTDREVRELVELVLGGASAAERLFHTPDHKPFAIVTVAGIEQTLAIDSRRFSRYLAAKHYEVHGEAPGRESLSAVRHVLEGRALYQGPEREVFTRIAPGPDGSIYLDLGDDQWRVVRVDKAGWGVLPRSPVRFRRAAGMLPLPRPERGGSVEKLCDYINVSEGDETLIVGWLIAALRDRGPFPVLILQGEQGSAKSTTSRVLRRLIDPNAADMRSQPKEPRDLAIAANNAWVIALDNLSSIPDWLSDGLCRLSTGGGFATRALFTDSDETILDATRPIILNGIDSIATRGDLLDRAIVLNLPVLETVREEEDLWRVSARF